MPFPRSRLLDIGLFLAVGLVGYMLYRRLPPAGEKAASVPPEMRAITIRVDPTSVTVPGTRVDAIYTCPNSDHGFGLENLTVVASEKRGDNVYITLQVSLERVKSVRFEEMPCLWKTVAARKYGGA